MAIEVTSILADDVGYEYPITCLANDLNENDKQSSKSSSNLKTRSLEHMVATIMNRMIQFVDAESLTEPEVRKKCILIKTIGSAACIVTTLEGLDGWSTAKHKDFFKVKCPIC